MSEIGGDTNGESAHASSIEGVAAAWLMQRGDRNAWDQTDQANLNAWLEASPAHLVTFWRLEAALDRTDRLRALQPTAKSSRQNWPRFYRVAGTLAVAVTLVFMAAAYFVLYPSETIYTTPVGGRETITLADGSRVELNTDSVLRARIGAYRRMVSLEKGEALFKVKHDANRPFVVSASGHRLTDVGTSFLVRSEASKFEVAVLEGQVEFESQDGRLRQPLFLSAGDVATGAENKIYVAKAARHDLVAKLGWQRGVLVFDHTTLAEAAAEFNRYNREKIRIADPYAAKRLIGGTFPTGDVGAFARLAHEVLGLHIENRDSETVISR